MPLPITTNEVTNKSIASKKDSLYKISSNHWNLLNFPIISIFPAMHEFLLFLNH